MVPNEIQEQRMREYFIQATKEILRGEGIKGVSVRNVAARAGYSYATIYNYFRDIRDLVFECVQDFQDECETSIHQEIGDTAQGLERIRAITLAYIKYFIQYPGTFELFFLEKTRDPARKKPAIELITGFLDRLCAEDWSLCIEKGSFPADQIEIRRQQLNHSVLGMLLFYMNLGQPDNYQDFKSQCEQHLDLILDAH